jgi:hypothetical protein
MRYCAVNRAGDPFDVRALVRFHVGAGIDVAADNVAYGGECLAILKRRSVLLLPCKQAVINGGQLTAPFEASTLTRSVVTTSASVHRVAGNGKAAYAGVTHRIGKSTPQAICEVPRAIWKRRPG